MESDQERASDTVHWTVTPGFLGDWFVAATAAGVCLMCLDVTRGREELAAWCQRHEPRASVREGTRELAAVAAELEAYRRGELRRFETPLDLRGTEFQLRVWAGLCDIPFGEVWSYKQLARHIGADGSYRAVGGANGRNPVSLIVPCHRVVASGTGIGGYTGGLRHKRRFLENLGVQRIFS
ncbi:MAG: methylated-DNA--[protein]-cysteine S-methyltransferase [Planctomycetota bacterium]|nr:methylated-DNA--[protein]-cysteine S-methyltransferase [Planctomycetota bacterium]